MPGRLDQARSRARKLKRKLARDREFALAGLVADGARVNDAGRALGLSKGETARAWMNIKAGLGEQCR